MNILCIGHSHIGAPLYAYKHHLQTVFPDFSETLPNARLTFVNLGPLDLYPVYKDGKCHPIPEALRIAILEACNSGKPDIVFLWIGGSYQHDLGLVNDPIPFDVVLQDEPDLPISAHAHIIPYSQLKAVMALSSAWKFALMKSLAQQFSVPIYQFEAPPPVESAEHITAHATETLRKLIDLRGVSPAIFRYKLWRIHSLNYQEQCRDSNIVFLPAPSDGIRNGYLVERAWHKDPIHANVYYGGLVLRSICKIANEIAALSSAS